MYLIGVDLGQKRDHTAIAVLEKIEARRPWNAVDFLGLHVRHVERVALQTPYPLVVERVRQLVHMQPLRGDCILAVDATGVGAPVVDLMRRAGMGCEIAAISITGSGKAALVGNTWHVPKVDLWSLVTLLLERGELKISGGMKGRAALVRELEELQARTGAARSGEQDDLAMAVALAVWKASKSGFGITGGGTRVDHYDAVLKYHCRMG
jgi:hypothetical protein